MEARIIGSYCSRIWRATACFSLVLFLSHASVSADDRETEMFNAGYEYLFSFRPDKAAETFRAFLREFPESSARDAAMFWLAKTLVSLRSYAEAEQTFLAVKKNFPESPFVSFIDNEMEEIARQRSSGPAKGPVEPPQSKSVPGGERAFPENDARYAQLMAERDRLRASLEEEKRSAAELQQRNADLAAKGSVHAKEIEERERLSAETEKLRSEKNRVERERDEARQQLREYDKQRGTGESLVLRVTELEQQLWQKDTELAQSKEVQEKIRLQSAQDRKASEDLRSEISRLKDTEKQYKALLAKTNEHQGTPKAEAADASGAGKDDAAEVRKYREQMHLLQTENRELSTKVEDMEHQAEQRIKDMKILNSYLTKLMFVRKGEPTQQPPSAELETLRTELGEEKKRSADLKEKTAAADAREADLRKQLAALKEKAASTPSPDTESLKTQLIQEKKLSAELREKMTAIEAREAGLNKQLAALKEKQQAPSAELETLRTELGEEKKRSADLEGKIAAADAREADLRKQIAALKEQKPVPQKPAESKQPFQERSAQTAGVTIHGKQYPLSEIVGAAAVSDRTLEKLRIRTLVWRSGDPLDDFINEQLLSDEAMKTGVLPDEMKYHDIAGRLKLAADEAAYLRRFMLIGSLIDRNFKNGSSELFIEILTVDFRSGDASVKTVLATDLQKAARSGTSFEDIQKMHRDSVKFSRLTVDEFAKHHKDRSQIIKKLNFTSGETVVMWSEKGYMIIKPVTVSRQFDPFSDISKEDREKIRAFLADFIAGLRKNM